MKTEIKNFPEPQTYSDKDRPSIVLDSVESSQVKAIGYDLASKTLAVQFKHGAGAIYHYPGVEKETFDQFMAAESKGIFFKQHIKSLAFEKFRAEAKNDGDPQVPAAA